MEGAQLHYAESLGPRDRGDLQDGDVRVCVYIYTLTQVH